MKDRTLKTQTKKSLRGIGRVLTPFQICVLAPDPHSGKHYPRRLMGLGYAQEYMEARGLTGAVADMALSLDRLHAKFLMIRGVTDLFLEDPHLEDLSTLELTPEVMTYLESALSDKWDEEDEEDDVRRHATRLWAFEEHLGCQHDLLAIQFGAAVLQKFTAQVSAGDGKALRADRSS